MFKTLTISILTVFSVIMISFSILNVWQTIHLHDSHCACNNIFMHILNSQTNLIGCHQRPAFPIVAMIPSNWNPQVSNSSDFFYLNSNKQIYPFLCYIYRRHSKFGCIQNALCTINTGWVQQQFSQGLTEIFSFFEFRFTTRSTIRCDLQIFTVFFSSFSFQTRTKQ